MEHHRAAGDDLDRRALQGFIGWFTDRPGRLSDRSIRNALTPLRRCLDAATGEGLIDGDLARSLWSCPRVAAGAAGPSASGAF